jgi:hypothetical protein
MREGGWERVFSQKEGPNMSVVAKLGNRSPYFPYNALFNRSQLHTKPPIFFSQKLGLVLSKFNDNNELLHTCCEVSFG